MCFHHECLAAGCQIWLLGIKCLKVDHLHHSFFEYEMGKKHSKPEDGALIIHLHFKHGKTKTEICAETGYGEKTVRITVRNYVNSTILGFWMLLTHFVPKNKWWKWSTFETPYTQQPNLTSSPKSLMMKLHCWTSIVSLNYGDATSCSQYMGYLDLLTL